MERQQDMKMDGGKIMMELIPTSLLTSVGTVLTYGAHKYRPNGWKEVDKERYIGALIRHLLAYMDDNSSKDEESGLYHIEHLCCNAAFLNDFLHKELKTIKHFDKEEEPVFGDMSFLKQKETILKPVVDRQKEYDAACARGRKETLI